MYFCCIFLHSPTYRICKCPKLRIICGSTHGQPCLPSTAVHELASPNAYAVCHSRSMRPSQHKVMVRFAGACYYFSSPASTYMPCSIPSHSYIVLSCHCILLRACRAHQSWRFLILQTAGFSANEISISVASSK